MKKNLLIIERNTRGSLTSLLANEGYSIYQAETAGAGLKALKQHRITHAVILNAISMRTKGDRTCASLKRAAPQMPVLVYSGQEKPSKADELLRPGIKIRKLINRIELYSPYNSMARSTWMKRSKGYSRPAEFPTCAPKEFRS